MLRGNLINTLIVKLIMSMQKNAIVHKIGRIKRIIDR